MIEEHTDIAIIGAGVSGLAAGLLLQDAGCDFKIIEARARLGGRIHSVRNPAGHVLGDLGPTWVWPPYQPVIRQWLDRLELTLVDQYESGQAVVDAGPGQPLQTGFAPDQQGIARIAGYSQALIDALADRLPDGAVSLESAVAAVEVSQNRATLRVTGAEPRHVHAKYLVCAVPPRVALAQITWMPSLPDGVIAAMSASPTWMAQHAKAVALFEGPIWRDNGLSGRIIGRQGPLMEAHDHSGPEGSPAAIFGFLGWPHQMRAEHRARLEGLIAAQLERCFGAPPTQAWIEDWAADPYTAAPGDLSGPMDHPSVGPEVLRQGQFAGRLVFAGAETATQSPGLIEGALVSAEHAVTSILGEPS